MVEKQQGENQAVIELVDKLHGVQLVHLQRGHADQVQAAVLPQGMKVESIKHLLDQYLTRPERKKGTTLLSTLEAFTAYVNRHRESESVVFCDDTNDKPALVAVFNAHTHTENGQQSSADYQDHRAVYRFPLSEQWQAWTDIPESFTQADFARFLEDRIVDVLEPASAGSTTKELITALGVQLAGPSKLLELSRGLAINVDQRLASHLNLSTGEGQLVFKEEHKDETGAPVKVPGAFLIGIPVFRLGPPYRVLVRLRYRAGSGRVTWQLSLHRTTEVFEDAVVEAAKRVAEQTQLPVFRGKPEGN